MNDVWIHRACAIDSDEIHLPKVHREGNCERCGMAGALYAYTETVNATVPEPVEELKHGISEEKAKAVVEAMEEAQPDTAEPTIEEVLRTDSEAKALLDERQVKIDEYKAKLKELEDEGST